MTGPLTTRSPAVSNPGAEIERVFRDVGERHPTDVSAVMARDSSVSPEVVRQLGQPTTYADFSRRSAEAAASNRRIVAPRLSTGTGSPFHSPSTSRLAQPNVYRPTMYGSSGGTLSGTGGSTSSAGGSRPLVTPRTDSPRVGGSRPVIVPGTNSSIYSRPTTRPSGSPTVRGSTPPSSSSWGSSSGRYTAPRSGSVSGGRSSGSTSRSSVGSSRPSTGSSRSSSAGSARSSGGGARSSASSSRPSGGSSSRSPSSSGAKQR